MWCDALSPLPKSADKHTHACTCTHSCLGTDHAPSLDSCSPAAGKRKIELPIAPDPTLQQK
jgi:hypothetical protein